MLSSGDGKVRGARIREETPASRCVGGTFEKRLPKKSDKNRAIDWHWTAKTGQPMDKISQIVDMARQLRTTEWRQAALLNVNKWQLFAHPRSTGRINFCQLIPKLVLARKIEAVSERVSNPTKTCPTGKASMGSNAINWDYLSAVRRPNR